MVEISFAWIVLIFASAAVILILNGILQQAHKAYKSSHPDEKVPPLMKVGWHWPFLAGLGIVFQVVLVYYAWVCVHYNQGKLLYPASWTPTGIVEFAREQLWPYIVDKAYPTSRAWTIWLTWVAMQALFFAFAPGPEGQGALLPDGKSRLTYKYNGQFSFMVTLPLVASLHYFGIFRITELFDIFPELISVCSIYTCIVCFLLELYTIFHGTGCRVSNSFVYNYYMGTQLNPRPFGFDLKFFHEIRVGIPFWFAITVAMAMKMYERQGQFTVPMMLVVMGHLFFVNSCFKGEDCIPHSMDIVYENFGWMLLGLDVIMVPFVFPLQAYYLLMVPIEFPAWYNALVFFIIVFGYWMFDSSNAQKDYFRSEQAGVTKISRGFPHVPWSELKNLTKDDYIVTAKGTKLLCAGWWKWGRHMNYTGDLLQGLGWSLACGVGSFIPWIYIGCYLFPLLVHRERRDDLHCAEKYGKDWEEYRRRVPYRLIPYIY